MKKSNNVVLGVVSVLVKNSNHNSDFDGPRTIGGQLVATDKSLKYYFRYYVDSNKEKFGTEIFYRKTLNEKSKPVDIVTRAYVLGCKEIVDYFRFLDNRIFGCTIIGKKNSEENNTDTDDNNTDDLDSRIKNINSYIKNTDKKIKDKKTESSEKDVLVSELDKYKTELDILKNQKKELDKFVGCTFNGSLQLTYGGNIFKNSKVVHNTITSQFQSGDSKDASTIGSEHKVSEANYIHNFTLHPKKLDRDILLNSLKYDDKTIKPIITENDVELVKHAFSACVGSSLDGSYNSASKSGTTIGLTIYVTLNEDCQKQLSISNVVSCEEYNKYNLSKLYSWVEKNRNHIKLVDISYVDGVVEFTEDFPNDDIYNISDGGYDMKK
jgi:hypothetical protein